MDLTEIINTAKKCKICEDTLPLGAKPVFSVSSNSKVIIIGQAPGLKVHQSGIPWDDQSGDRLRNWLGVDKSTFYDPNKFGILPMGFCYPGKSKTGDLPPKKICAPTWHRPILQKLDCVEITLLIGSYAQKNYLNTSTNLTYNVKHFHQFLPKYFVLPHPSPRNGIWLKKNSWFSEDILPILRQKIAEALKL